jgi:hypothetical protein
MPKQAPTAQTLPAVCYLSDGAHWYDLWQRSRASADAVTDLVPVLLFDVEDF